MKTDGRQGKAIDLSARIPAPSQSSCAASNSPKLLVELVPRPCFWANLRTNLPSKEWDRLRKRCYEKANYCCEICGGIGKKHRVECHEMWEYNDDRCLQKLTGLVALCPACHATKHAGLSATRGELNRVYQQLMKVNGWTRAEAIDHVAGAFAVWNDRSLHGWDRDLSWLEENHEED